MEDIQQLSDIICRTLDSKKASDIVVVDIAHLTIVADRFIICSGRSTTQVKGLAGAVEEELSKNHGIEPLRTEGVGEGRWAVLDYGSILVHIFHEETRQLYTLEQLWADGGNVTRYESTPN